MAEDAEFTVACRHRRTPVIAELLLRLAGPPLRHQPGQYVLLGDPGAGLVVRSYSIANAPRRDGLISLLVTRVPGGQLSGWVHDVLRPGDRVLRSGPYGSFTAAPGEHAPVLFIPPPARGSITITHFHALSGRASAGRQPGIRSRSPFPSVPRCTKTSSPSVLTP